jgi:hypothetical protein
LIHASAEKSPVPKSRMPLAGSAISTTSLPPSKLAAVFASVARAPGVPSVTPFLYTPLTPLADASPAIVPVDSPSRQYPAGLSAITASR